MPESRRAHYRVTYPFVERPIFEIGRRTYEIVECSERGLRYSISDRAVPKLGSELGGSVQFRRGKRVEVAGEVARTNSGVVVLVLLLQPIPMAEILLEQQYLRAKGYTLLD
jgi:hypothetical protein